ncbi:hypothetical protein PAAG_12478 [Paracoccidioides lutzii Pb01]|uniref:Uncharacterized protein n=1 Tax=Paracoccidioides lutzii (strain ATCC MYA-826 / Pb01) TaxID=502779 RepID=A0A0A2UZ49_PARBA|nr:hypothetical protein PAAG_12478 [Paracoccidioides lutzii Pb01]KGQ00851.1 hypothetical protein PAAG_12478 [Paracoccidioides lutzii Pb01]
MPYKMGSAQLTWGDTADAVLQKRRQNWEGEGEDSPEAADTRWQDGVSRVRLYRNIAKEDQETASTTIVKNAKNGMRRIERKWNGAKLRSIRDEASKHKTA